MRAFSQDEEIFGCRESWFVAVVSDINGRSDGTRDISFGLPQGANAATRLMAAVSWLPRSPD